MKYYIKIVFAALVLTFASCESTELDLLNNPNAVTPDKADINFVYNSMAGGFENVYTNAYFLTAPLARMSISTGGFTYNDMFTAASYSGIWSNAYAGFFPDASLVEELAVENQLDFHTGTAKIMKAYVLLTLVDIFGDVPYSQAFQGVEVISPTSDPGQDVYNAAMTLLDESIALLTDTEAPAPDIDNFYDGDASKWVTLAKTLKLKIYVQTRLVDSSAGSQIAALVSAGDIIDGASEDFQFQFGTTRANPNSRHPFYNNAYETSDATYQSNYYMWLLRAEKGLDASDNEIIDPRIRFYFYRQTSSSFDQDVNVYSCIFSDEPDQSLKPAHYIAVDPRLPYCVASEDGYYGRDHMNGSGIPPDGPIRTVWGLYPGGGKFDDSSFDDIQNSGTDGALGQGIHPMMLSSFVYFMRAEAAMTAGTGEDAAALLESGIRASMDKVSGFSSLIDVNAVVGRDPQGNDITLQQAYLDSFDDDVDDYVGIVMDRFNAASDAGKLDIMMKEYLIALYGNGVEAYNSIRRTSMPSNLQPSIEPASGTYVWSAWYPSNHVDLNSSATQKPDVTQKVFWDNTPADAVN